MRPNTTSMAIKARVFNKQRVLFFEKKLENFNAFQKQQIFDEIFKEVRDAHNELNNYKHKRKFKAHVQAERIKRGYTPKKVDHAKLTAYREANGMCPMCGGKGYHKMSCSSTKATVLMHE